MEFSCRKGSLINFFDAKLYKGTEVNGQIIFLLKENNTKHQFNAIEHIDETDKTDAWLAYTILSHISDGAVLGAVNKLCMTSQRVVVAEVVNKQTVKRKHMRFIFDRDLMDYEVLFQSNGFCLYEVTEIPYSDTNISFMDFRPYN